MRLRMRRSVFKKRCRDKRKRSAGAKSLKWPLWNRKDGKIVRDSSSLLWSLIQLQFFTIQMENRRL
jgi:hypothetical protein